MDIHNLESGYLAIYSTYYVTKLDTWCRLVIKSQGILCGDRRAYKNVSHLKKRIICIENNTVSFIIYGIPSKDGQLLCNLGLIVH